MISLLASGKINKKSGLGHFYILSQIISIYLYLTLLIRFISVLTGALESSSPLIVTLSALSLSLLNHFIQFLIHFIKCGNFLFILIIKSNDQYPCFPVAHFRTIIRIFSISVSLCNTFLH
jgi:hypothetical protein